MHNKDMLYPTTLRIVIGKSIRARLFHKGSLQLFRVNSFDLSILGRSEGSSHERGKGVWPSVVYTRSILNGGRGEVGRSRGSCTAWSTTRLWRTGTNCIRWRAKTARVQVAGGEIGTGKLTTSHAGIARSQRISRLSCWYEGIGVLLLHLHLLLLIEVLLLLLRRGELWWAGGHLSSLSRWTDHLLRPSW